MPEPDVFDVTPAVELAGLEYGLQLANRPYHDHVEEAAVEGRSRRDPHASAVVLAVGYNNRLPDEFPSDAAIHRYPQQLVLPARQRSKGGQ